MATELGSHIFVTQNKQFGVFFHGNSGDRIHDVVDFFDKFSIKLYVGWVDISEVICGDLSERVFQPLNKFFAQDRDFCSRPYHSIKDMPSSDPFVTSYYTKHVYWEDPSGESWHTPITGFFLERYNKIQISKGSNKISAAKLAGIDRLPMIVSSWSKRSPRPGLNKVKSDRSLRDFLDVVSGGQVQDPTLGIEFIVADLDSHQIVPAIHWITINRAAKSRPDYDQNLWADIDHWRTHYPGRLVVSDVLPSATVGYDHKKLTGVHLDIEHIRAAMPESAVAYIHANDDPDICARLTEALVWLSSDQHGHEVGEMKSADGRYRIVYNNDSLYTLLIPPGLYK